MYSQSFLRGDPNLSITIFIVDQSRRNPQEAINIVQSRSQSLIEIDIGD